MGLFSGCFGPQARREQATECDSIQTVKTIVQTKDTAVNTVLTGNISRDVLFQKAASRWEVLSHERFLSCHTSPVMWAVLSSGGARLLWASDTDLAHNCACQPELQPTHDAADAQPMALAGLLAGCHSAHQVLQEVMSKGLWRGRVTLDGPPPCNGQGDATGPHSRTTPHDPRTSSLGHQPLPSTLEAEVSADASKSTLALPLSPPSLAPPPPTPALSAPPPKTSEPKGTGGAETPCGCAAMEVAAAATEWLAALQPGHPTEAPLHSGGDIGHTSTDLKRSQGLGSSGNTLWGAAGKGEAAGACAGGAGGPEILQCDGPAACRQPVLPNPDLCEASQPCLREVIKQTHSRKRLAISGSATSDAATKPLPSPTALKTPPLSAPSNLKQQWEQHLQQGSHSSLYPTLPSAHHMLRLSSNGNVGSTITMHGHSLSRLSCADAQRAAAAARQRGERVNLVDLVGQTGAARASALLAACSPSTPASSTPPTTTTTTTTPPIAASADAGAPSGQSIHSWSLVPQVSMIGREQRQAIEARGSIQMDSRRTPSYTRHNSVGNHGATLIVPSSTPSQPQAPAGAEAAPTAAAINAATGSQAPIASAPAAPCQSAPAPHDNIPYVSAPYAAVHNHTVLDVAVERVADPDSGVPVLVVSLQDATTRAALEAVLGQLAEGQLAMTVQMFPLHILAAMAGTAAAPPNTAGAVMPPTPSPDKQQLARSHQDVTLLFMDIQGFTSMAKVLEAHQVMGYINDLFSLFDDLVEAHGVHKVETAGDCYIVSAGAVVTGPDGFMRVLETHNPANSAARVMAFAKDMLAAARTVVMPHTGLPSTIRVGLHTGPCTSGLVGSRLPKFSLFGDSMNTASRMESTAPVGRIQVSEATHALLPQERWEATGGVEVKGKGLMMTYLWVPPQPSLTEVPGTTITAPALRAAHVAGALTSSAPCQRIGADMGPPPPWSASVAQGHTHSSPRNMPVLSAHTCSKRPDSSPPAPVSWAAPSIHLPPAVASAATTAAATAASGMHPRGSSTAAATLALSSLWALADSVYGEGVTGVTVGGGGAVSYGERANHTSNMRMGSCLQHGPISADEGCADTFVRGVGVGGGVGVGARRAPVVPPGGSPMHGRQDDPARRAQGSSSQLPRLAWWERTTSHQHNPGFVERLSTVSSNQTQPFQQFPDQALATLRAAMGSVLGANKGAQAAQTHQARAEVDEHLVVGGEGPGWP